MRSWHIWLIFCACVAVLLARISCPTPALSQYGPGISAKDARRLFRPFCKSAKDAANSAPGVGLGLALSRRLARHIGARLDLDRKSEGGACFWLSLPKAR